MIIEHIKNPNEKNAFLREVWAQGYDKLIKDVVSYKVKLISVSDKYIKEVCLRDFDEFTRGLTVIMGSNLTGSVHSWISEKDGSASRFREFIKK